MPLPHAVARFNSRVTNRWIEPIARQSSGFAVVHHRGRRTGRPYTTPVNVFTRGDDLIVVLTYGPQADWFQNVVAGGGSIEREGTERRIRSITVVDRAEAWPALPRIVRAALRLLRVRDFAYLTLDV